MKSTKIFFRGFLAVLFRWVQKFFTTDIIPLTSSIWDVNLVAGLMGKFESAGAIFAVDGTAYLGYPGIPPPGAGFASGLAYGLTQVSPTLWSTYLIPYPAAAYPMAPSIEAGRATLKSELSSFASGYYASHHQSYDGMVILMTGYSQGAMVVGLVWKLDIFDPDGELHYLLPYVYRIYNFGDPYRCPGIAWGNVLMGKPLPSLIDGVTTGGIGGPCNLTPAQTNFRAPDGKHIVQSFVNPGDLYADCPVGDSPWTNKAFLSLGKNALASLVGRGKPSLWSAKAKAGAAEYSIFGIVQHATFANVAALAADLLMPIGTIEGIINAWTFFIQGANAPHWHYEAAMQAAVDDALALGNSLPHLGPM